MAAAPDKSTDKPAWPAQSSAQGAVVVPLRPRRGGTARDGPAHADAQAEVPVGDLSPYERRNDEGDDYRHRMIANVAALAFTILLVLSGLWIANTIAEMRKNQDCVLSGNRNCTPVVIPDR